MNRIMAILFIVFIIFASCDNPILDETLPDRKGGSNNNNGGGTGQFTLKLVPKNAEGSDKVSFSDTSSLTEITVAEGQNVLIYYTLADIKLTDELVLSFGPATKTVIIDTPSSSFFPYTVRQGDAVNGVIAIIADFLHTDLTVLNSPTNVHFDKDGVITFTPGTNNAAAGCWYTYTLYRTDAQQVSIAVITDQPFQPNSSDPVIVTEMLSCDGFYTVKLKANTINPSYTSKSIESAHSEVVGVFMVTVTINGQSSTEYVTVQPKGIKIDQTAPVYVDYFFSGTEIKLTATPDTGRVTVWSGIGGSGDNRIIDSIWTNTYITVKFATPVLTLNPPSAVAYSNNYNNRNALTPLNGEHTATFTVQVSGFADDADANNAELAITPVVPGLTVSGHNVKVNASNGTKFFTIHVTYDGAATFTSGTKFAEITFNISVNMSTIPAVYSQTGTLSHSRNINVIDGQDERRSIPVTQNNYSAFNSYARSAAGLSKYYIQEEDITLPNTMNNWTPIGTNNARFLGTYNGDGKKIEKINIDLSQQYVGLFGFIGWSGTVKNLGVSGTITSTFIGNGETFAGGIAGGNAGTIINCYNEADVSISTNYAGGIVGMNSGNSSPPGNNIGKIANCYNTGKVTGNNSIGGIVGRNRYTSTIIENCYNTGEITGTGNQIGGIAGDNLEFSTVINCYNTGNVTGNDSVGGIVGAVNTATATITSSVSLGLTTVSNTGANIGRIYGTNNNNIPGMSGNKARNDIKIFDTTGQVTPSPTGTSTRNGESISVDGTVSLSTVFSGWNSAVWDIPADTLRTGGALPTLKDIPAGVQNPALP